MPFYQYHCTECDFTTTAYKKIADRDEGVGQQHAPAHCQGTMYRPPETPGFTSSESLGRIKAPGEFRQLLSAIKRQNPGSTINER